MENIWKCYWRSIDLGGHSTLKLYYYQITLNLLRKTCLGNTQFKLFKTHYTTKIEHVLITQKATANHAKILTFASWTAWDSSTLVLSSRPAYKQSRKTISIHPLCRTIRGSHLALLDTVDGEGLHGKQKRWWVNASNNLHKWDNTGDLFIYRE